MQTNLHPDHPLYPLMQRLRLYAAVCDIPWTAPAAEMVEYRQLLARLEHGLFERLPRPVINAVRQYGDQLDGAFKEIFLEIARCVADDLAIPDIWMDRFDRYVVQLDEQMAHAD